MWLLSFDLNLIDIDDQYEGLKGDQYGWSRESENEHAIKRG